MISELAALALGVAAPASPPAIIDPSPKKAISVQPRIIAGPIEHSDYPPAALRRGAQGTTQIRFIIRQDGKAFDCQVVQSSGHSDLDQRACSVVTTRTRFTPAIDVDGQPTATYAILPVSWQIAG